MTSSLFVPGKATLGERWQPEMLIISNLLNPSYPPFSKGRIYSPHWQRWGMGDFIEFDYPAFTEGMLGKHFLF